MSPQRRAELIAELDVLTREARRVASNRGVLRASRRDAKAQLKVLRQVAKVLHIELAVAGK